MRYSVKNVIIYEKLHVRIRVYVKIRGTSMCGVKYTELLRFWGRWRKSKKRTTTISVMIPVC